MQKGRNRKPPATFENHGQAAGFDNNGQYFELLPALGLGPYLPDWKGFKNINKNEPQKRPQKPTNQKPWQGR